MNLTEWLGERLDALEETAERAAVNLYVKKQRGYPLTDEEWAVYWPSLDGWPVYEEELGNRWTLPGYISFVPWWLDQCEIPGPRDGGWKDAD